MRPRPFYRSAAFRLVLIFAGAVSCWACAFAPPEWRDNPSLHLVRTYSLPGWLWGLGFLAFALMLTHPEPRWHVRGCWLAMGLYGIFFVSVVAAIRPDRPTYLVIGSLALIGLGALYQAAKLATFDREGL